MYKNFIFDMDGVLVDSEPLHYKIMTQVFSELQLSLTKQYRYSLTGMAGMPMWEKIVKDYQLPKKASDYLAFHTEVFFRELPNHEITEVKGVIQLLQRLKEHEYTLALASSSSLQLIDVFTQKLGIHSYFDVIVSGQTLPRSKPFPDIFLKVASLWAVPTQDCIVLEDSYNGVKAAKSAGMKCIGYQNPNSGNQDLSKADIIVHSMDEITFDLLEHLQNKKAR